MAPGRGVAAIAAVLLILAAVGLSAHEIPGDVRIRVFVKPEGQRLRLLVRVPLAAMVDIEWPEDGRTGVLDLSRADRALNDAAMMWIGEKIDLYEGDTHLPRPRIVDVRATQPSDLSFASYEQALAHVTGPKLPNNTEFIRPQGLLDVLFEYPIQSDRSYFSFSPEFDRLGLSVTTILQFLPPGGTDRAFEFHGDPGLVRLDPRWFQVAWRFVVLGFFDLLDGVDHLLFLLCLVLPLRRFRALVPVVTAFAVGHSITLMASASGMAPDAGWFPPLVETLVALSIFYMALDNIIGPDLRRRWMFAFGFGLAHGFSFSFALRPAQQLAGSHLLTSLLFFNLGVEIGLLVVLLVVVPSLVILFRFAVAERLGTIVLSALVGHTAWHLMVDRGAQVLLYQFQWPVLDAAFFALILRWLMLLVIVAGIAWLVFDVAGQSRRRGAESGT